jgi:FkbM family methyltransferase
LKVKSLLTDSDRWSPGALVSRARKHRTIHGLTKVAPYPLKAFAFSLLVLGILAGTLLATAQRSDQPAGAAVSREPIFADYVVPLTVVTVQGSVTRYTAQTAFWTLLPEAWRNSLDWRISFSSIGTQPEGVYVAGERVEPRQSTNPAEPPFYSVPARLIGASTSIGVVGSGVIDPNMYLHWNRSYIYPTSGASAGNGEFVQLAGSSVPFQLGGAQLEPCQPGYASAIPFIKSCSHNEQVLTLDGAGRSVVDMGGMWPSSRATISLWVRPLGSGHYCLFTNDDSVAKNLSLNVTIDGPGNILVFASTDGLTRSVLVGQNRLPAGLWSHLSISLSDRTLSLYVNGQPDGELHLAAQVHATSRPLVLGSDFSGPDHYLYGLNGQLAEVRLSNEAASPDAIQRIFLSDVIRDPQGYPPDDPRLIALKTQGELPWWRANYALSVVISAGYVLGLSLLFVWCFRELRRGFLPWPAVLALWLGFAGLFVGSLLTTTWDLQLYKGMAEGYWVNGPLPALTISGYGPLIDFVFTVPTLPYILLADLVGARSELALNLAIRLPFLLGWLFLIASVARTIRTHRSDLAPRFPWLLLLLNPLALVVTLWQPEALLVGIVVLSLAFLIDRRMIGAGILLGIAFSGKYWPAVVGPIMLIGAWRLYGLGAAAKFLATALSTALGIFALYWLPTAMLLRSPSDFVGLLVTRLPWLGGPHASAVATLWSLYAVPETYLPRLTTIISTVEQRGLLLFLVAYVGVLALSFRGSVSGRHVLLASGAVLAFLAGISSLTVPQFGLWSLPLVLLVGAGTARPPVFGWMAIAATWCGAGVFVFVEPLSYFLLHMSAAEDAFAHSSGLWWLHHVVNQHVAELLGFWFAFLLVSSAGLMTLRLARVQNLAEIRLSSTGGSRVSPVVGPTLAADMHDVMGKETARGRFRPIWSLIRQSLALDLRILRMRYRSPWWRMRFLGSKYVALTRLRLGPARFDLGPMSVTIRDISGLGTLQSSIVDFHDTMLGIRGLGRAPLIIDVGANIGQFVNAAKLFYPDARVICFEPDPDTFADLTLNTARLTDVELHNFGLGAKSETLTFHRHDLSGMSGFGAGLGAPAYSRGTTELPVRRLDDAIESSVLPDLLKVDVEGFEREVLEGGWQTVRRSRYLLIELSLGREEGSYNMLLLRDVVEHVPAASLVRFGRPLGELHRPDAQDVLVSLQPDATSALQ